MLKSTREFAVAYDIFVSYASEDQARVQVLTQRLQARGWSVFWDRVIPPGETWLQHIGGALDKARCVIVVWSHASVGSSWVYEEAQHGQRRGVLVPVLIDEVAPPLGFGAVQAATLVSWSGDADAPGFQALCQAVARHLGAEATAASPAPTAPAAPTAPTAPAPPPLSPASPPTAAEASTKDGGRLVGRRLAFGLLLAAAAFGAWYVWWRPPPAPWGGGPASMSIDVPAGKAQLTAGESIGLRSVVRYGNTTQVGGTDIRWSSSDPEVAAVSADGSLRAHRRGLADVTARLGTLSAQFRFTVLPAEGEPAARFTGFGTHVLKRGDRWELEYARDGAKETCEISWYEPKAMGMQCGGSSRTTAGGHLVTWGDRSERRLSYYAVYWWWARAQVALTLLDEARQIVQLAVAPHERQTVNRPSVSLRPGDRFLSGAGSYLEVDACSVEKGEPGVRVLRWGPDSRGRLQVLGSFELPVHGSERIDAVVAEPPGTTRAYRVVLAAMRRDEIGCIAEFKIE